MHKEYLGRLGAEYAALDRRMAALRELIRAAEAYLDGMVDETPSRPSQESGQGRISVDVPAPIRGPVSRTPSEWAHILRDTTQMQALERIAEANGGLVRVTEARNILRDIGRMRGKPKNLASHLYNMMNNSPKFEYDSPGVFRMVSAQPETTGTLFSEEENQDSQRIG